MRLRVEHRGRAGRADRQHLGEAAVLPLEDERRRLEILSQGGELDRALHSGVTLQSVQGPVQFNNLGQNNKPAAFVFQWQNGSFNQVLPAGAPGSATILNPKPHWSS